MKKFRGHCAALTFLLCLSVLLTPFRANALAVAEGTYTWPMSTDKEMTTGMYYSDGTYHGAADFSAAVGSPVFATANGVVVEVQDNRCQGSHYQGNSQYACPLGENCSAVTQFGENGGYGNYILIDHGGNMRVRYAQLQTGSFQVKVGDQVRQGQQIASSGISGNASVPHLHFEMLLDDVQVDPKDYLTRTKPDMINHNPVITLESAVSPVPGQLSVKGWAYDPDNTSAALRVNLYAAESASASGTLIGILTANTARQDVNTRYSCGVYHGFEQTVNVSLTGTFYIRAEAVNVGEGENVLSDNAPAVVFGVDSEPPTASLVSVGNLSPSGYSVTVSASDNVGVTSVRMPSWVGTYTSEVPWYQAVRMGDNWVCTIDRNGESGLWHTDVRTYDAAGNQAPIISIYLRYLTLTLNPNGGTVVSGTRPVFNVSYLTDYRNQTYVGTYGDYAPLPDAVRRGYTFDGWYTQAEGGTRIQDSTIVTSTSDITLYAHWARSDSQPPVITGVAVNDISASGYTVSVTATDNVAVTDVRMSSWVGAYSSSVTPESAEHSGSAWNHTVERHDESGIWHTEVHAYDEAENESALASVYLRRITVSFNPNGGVCSTLNQTMYSAYYVINYRNQTFVNTYGTLPVASRNGYTFGGWYTSASGGTQVTASSLISSEVNHTLYARWTTGNQPSNPDNPPVNPNPPVTGDEDIIVGTVSAAPGASVKVPISLVKNPGVISMTLRLEYDANALTLTNVQDGGLLGSYEGSQSAYSAIPYTLAWSDDTATADHTATGTIATLTFTLSEDAVDGRDYAVRLSYDNTRRDDIFNYQLQPVNFSIAQGAVHATSVIIGDVNKDGRVTALDRAALARHLAGWTGYTETDVDLTAADVNQDLRVTGLDRTILARHLAGWTGYENLPWTSAALSDGDALSSDETFAYSRDTQRSVVWYGGKSAVSESPSGKDSGFSGKETVQFSGKRDSAELSAMPAVVTSSALMQDGRAAFAISLENNPGIISMRLNVSYPDALELVDVKDSGMFGGETFHEPDTAKNPYLLSWNNDTGSDVIANGTLATLYFRLKSGRAAGSYPVTVSYSAEEDDIFNYNLQPVTFDVRNSSITFTSAGQEVPDSSITFGSITRTNGSVTVPVSCPDALSGNVFCAAYDGNGKLVSVSNFPLMKTAAGSYFNYQFAFGNTGVYQSVSVFVLDGTYNPLCGAKRQTF